MIYRCGFESDDQHIFAPILGTFIFQLTVAYYKKCMFETTVNHEALEAYTTSLRC